MKKILFIMVVVFSMISLIFYYGIKINQAHYQKFVTDGYIISKSGDKAENIQTTKYYFTALSKYKKNYDKSYTFTSSDNQEITVSPYSFVHYLDGSIATLHKTVLLDLDKLNTQVIKYYNFHVGSRLHKEKDSYTTVSDKNNLSFTQFMMKIDENKYLLVAPKIKLFIGEDQKEIKDSYLEIEYFDGNIIRIENQEMQIQNISTNFYIEIGNDIRINLADKNIFLNNERVLNMTQMTVDKDDNIEIPPEKEELPKEEENPNNTPSPTKNPLENLTDGTIPVLPNDEEEIAEEKKMREPTFQVIEMSTSSNKFSADVEYQDPDSLLTGNILLKIIETGTNKIVYQTRENTGLSRFSVEVENLNQNTNYVFVVSSDYQKDEKMYTRDFIQKSFVTESIGVSLEKNYFTTEELNFYVVKDSYSRVESVDISISDRNGTIIETQKVELKDLTNSKKEVSFLNLQPNTLYKIKVFNFVYDNSMISDQFAIEEDYKTLKLKPIFGEPSYTIDKKNSQFTLKVNNISDINNGVISYRYDIYDARSLADNPSVVQSIEKANNSTASVTVDNITIERGVPYVYKLVALFDDNEKQYEYQTDYSNVMQLDGVEFPSVRFESHEVTFEKISGNIIITDNGNTINFSETNIMTIAYTDSVGNTRSFTTTGNSTIPFSVNNLRANETYTISVYAPVNLQDGNDLIDNCFIGSVVVKTDPTKPFVLQYVVNEDKVSHAFYVTSQLSTENNINNTLEASTLTGLVFNLYAGKTTTGNLVKSVRKVDRNLEPYESDLKINYYDNSFVLNPDFFGLKNQDLTSEYYTIEVTNAYDYTTYKNKINIHSNTITFKVNGFVPDIPSDTSNAIDVAVIRNNNSGDKHRDDLKSDTIVGYQIRANYDNAKKYAKSIEYKLFDSTTGKLIETRVAPVKEDGSIEYEKFYLEDGTDQETVDEDFRRGNKYYFTYTVNLDLNLDGTPETLWPPVESSVVLKSKVIQPNKQEPIFRTYPSTMKNGKLIWNYSYQDVDNVLIVKNMYYKIENRELGFVPIEKTGIDEFQKAEFSVNQTGYLTLYVKENVQKSDKPLDKTLVYQYYELPYNASSQTYNVSIETNRVLVTLTDYYTNPSFYKRVAGAKLVFKVGSETVVKDNLSIDDSGVIILDLAELEQFMGQKINCELYLYYDNGIMGFDTEVNSDNNHFSLQMIQNKIYSGEYYKLNDKLNLISDINAMSSNFEMNLTRLSAEDGNLVLKDLGKNKSSTIPLKLDYAGYNYNYEYLFPKQLSSVKMNGDGTENFSFDVLVPGISLLLENNNLNITPYLTSADTKIKLYGKSSSIKDKKIYIDLYETSEENSESKLIRTIETSVDSIDNTIHIDDLKPNTDYYFKVMADIINGSSYERMQLYDIDFKNNTRNYYFKTLNTVGANNIRLIYTAFSYENRNFKLSYDLNEIVGYDRISYQLYKIVEDSDGSISKELVPLEISDSTTFIKEMTKYISISPGSKVSVGEKYIVEIHAFATIKTESSSKEVELETAVSPVYTFVKLSDPYVGIKTTHALDGKVVKYQIKFYDTQKTVYNDEYTITMYDEDFNDITPIEYKDKKYKIGVYADTFELNNIVPNKKYSIKINYKINVFNELNTIEDKEKVYTISSLNDSGISVGDIYAVTNLMEENKVNLAFYNSYRLASVDAIRYSIYDSSGQAIDNEIPFLPILNTSEDNSYYVFTLPDSILDYGIYYIQIQFLVNDNVIAEETIQYNYIAD